MMFEKVEILNTAGSPYTIPVTNLTSDSRAVSEGDMFVAVRGSKTDGHNYIQKAIECGAKVIVCETLPSQIDANVSYIQVEDTSRSLGYIASEVYDYPSDKLSLIGVTGTNGKTTTATLLYDIFTKLGYKVGLISTVVNKISDKEYPAINTTPGPVQLQVLLKQMVDEGCQYCFMEVSSHGIAQARIAGLTFKGGVFTNITRDHLDFHKTFEEYIRVKKLFFDSLPSDAFAVTNIDDRNGLVMLQNTKAKKRTYSLLKAADYKSKIIESHLDGMSVEFNGIPTWVRLIGKFNAYNLTAIFAVTQELGIDKQTALQVISSLSPVVGRFDTVRSKDGVVAIVDYAHTPDALENVLKTINDLKCSGHVITVVGCGGDRDKGKRPMMAKIGAMLSDTLILTSDNPRTENPKEILDDMITGLDDERQAIVIEDRKQAILVASKMAKSGDIILIAGKGHETYQEIKGTRFHFDDMEEIKSCMGI